MLYLPVIATASFGRKARCNCVRTAPFTSWLVKQNSIATQNP